jgi:hypothetical protein
VDECQTLFCGRACRDRHHKVPILGVVPMGNVTYPEDDRPGGDQRVPLEPNHTHLVGRCRLKPAEPQV